MTLEEAIQKTLSNKGRADAEIQAAVDKGHAERIETLVFRRDFYTDRLETLQAAERIVDEMGRDQSRNIFW